MTTSPNKIRVHIRWLIRRDMAEVLEIENRSFGFPWSGEDFVRCLRQRNCIAMVAEYDGRVVGFMVYEMHKNLLHLLNFAVHSDFRRSCVGQAMIDKLKNKLCQERRSQITLEVWDSNLTAQLFFRAMGFKATGVLRDFYPAAPGDAYRFQFRLEAA